MFARKRLGKGRIGFNSDYAPKYFMKRRKFAASLAFSHGGKVRPRHSPGDATAGRL